MKNFLRIFAFLLAAAFVFAACDSSGGGEEQQQPESVSYSGRTDGKLVKLTLTASGAASRTSGGQRVPYAFTGGGTYTLHVDNVLVSSGTFSVSGDTLRFASTAGKTFTATAPGNTPPVFTTAIPLDTVIGEITSIAPPQMYNNDIFKIQVYKPDGKKFTGDVDLQGFWYSQYSLSDSDTKPISNIGKIENGLLTLNLPSIPNPEETLDLGSYEGQEFYTGEIRFTAGSKTIGLGLEKNAANEGFSIGYFISETDIPINGITYEPGWVYNIWVTDADGNGTTMGVPRPLQELYDNGYKWVYNDNPLVGKTWLDSNGRSGSFEFSADGKYTFVNDDGYTEKGSYIADNLKITFKPDSGSGEWEVFYVIMGECLTLQKEANEWWKHFLR